MTSITDHLRDLFYASIGSPEQRIPRLAPGAAPVAEDRTLSVHVDLARRSLAEVMRIARTHPELLQRWCAELAECSHALRYATDRSSGSRVSIAVPEYQGRAP